MTQQLWPMWVSSQRGDDSRRFDEARPALPIRGGDDEGPSRPRLPANATQCVKARFRQSIGISMVGVGVASFPQSWIWNKVDPNTSAPKWVVGGGVALIAGGLSLMVHARKALKECDDKKKRDARIEGHMRFVNWVRELRNKSDFSHEPIEELQTPWWEVAAKHALAGAAAIKIVKEVSTMPWWMELLVGAGGKTMGPAVPARLFDDDILAPSWRGGVL